MLFRFTMTAARRLYWCTSVVNSFLHYVRFT